MKQQLNQIKSKLDTNAQKPQPQDQSLNGAVTKYTPTPSQIDASTMVAKNDIAAFSANHKSVSGTGALTDANPILKELKTAHDKALQCIQTGNSLAANEKAFVKMPKTCAITADSYQQQNLADYSNQMKTYVSNSSSRSSRIESVIEDCTMKAAEIVQVEQGFQTVVAHVTGGTGSQTNLAGVAPATQAARNSDAVAYEQLGNTFAQAFNQVGNIYNNALGAQNNGALTQAVAPDGSASGISSGFTAPPENVSPATNAGINRKASAQAAVRNLLGP